jgi:Calcineurin-like phosphoesterase
MRAIRSVIVVTTLLGASAFWDLRAQAPELPNLPDSVKFAVIGDNGTGKQPQYEIGHQMALARATFQFDLVIMVGDNVYGGQSAADYVDKFERPYKPLLVAGVLFQAALGNHDSPDSRFYRPFNMNGQRYYTFARKNVRFFVLDTNFLDAAQLAWFESAAADAQEEWKIAYFHHPLYSNAARHGSAVDVRVLLEPFLVKHGVHVVFAGHDHIYERIRPQKGIHHFLTGSSGQLRRGDLQSSPITAAGFDRDQTFVLVEIVASEMFFRTVSRAGAAIDSGVIHRRTRPSTTDAASTR